MELYNAMVGIVTEVDPINMKARVQVPTSGMVTHWLHLLVFSGSFYSIPLTNDQVVFWLDDRNESGVIIGTIVKDGEGSYDDKDITGIKIGDTEIMVARSTGQVSIKSSKITLDGDLEVTGDIKVTGDVDVTGAVGATGEVSGSEVSAGIIKLTLHKHPTAGTGAPSPPIP